MPWLNFNRNWHWSELETQDNASATPIHPTADHLNIPPLMLPLDHIHHTYFVMSVIFVVYISGLSIWHHKNCEHTQGQQWAWLFLVTACLTGSILGSLLSQGLTISPDPLFVMIGPVIIKRWPVLIIPQYFWGGPPFPLMISMTCQNKYPHQGLVKDTIELLEIVYSRSESS